MPGSPPCRTCRGSTSSGLPLLGDIADADHGVVLPPRSEGVPVQLGFDIGETDVEVLPRDREDLPVRRERVEADAERRVACLRDVAEQVLPALEPEDVRDEQPQPPSAQVHVPCLPHVAREDIRCGWGSLGWCGSRRRRIVDPCGSGHLIVARAAVSGRSSTSCTARPDDPELRELLGPGQGDDPAWELRRRPSRDGCAGSAATGYD